MPFDGECVVAAPRKEPIWSLQSNEPWLFDWTKRMWVLHSDRKRQQIKEEMEETEKTEDSEDDTEESQPKRARLDNSHQETDQASNLKETEDCAHHCLTSCKSNDG
ncbi:hypothetical protein K458DRAFT_396828 [Lentithecium fluviatile CBS 122367]|uniref:Uncharacterized protein n=1 Tax=Lentithecium fluviatile CBS 122367 TaxID=1168545 RepID=A0A6G1IEX7_9PLEO|nr:hypothetical protein K458DRAFT_396828 [Lentithecium fluviatile CBS 122367]